MDNMVNHLYAFTIIFECIKGIRIFHTNMEQQIVHYCTVHEHICWEPSYEREDTRHCSFERIRLGDLVPYVRRRTMERIASDIHNMSIQTVQRRRPKTKL